MVEALKCPFNEPERCDLEAGNDKASSRTWHVWDSPSGKKFLKDIIMREENLKINIALGALEPL